jgi:DNA-binding beta-propeller fold protein YncE
VVRIDRETGEQTPVADVPPGADNLAFDSGGRLFTSSFWNGSILEVLPGGERRTVSTGGLVSPQGVAVYSPGDSVEAVLVADVFTWREFDGFTGEQNRQSFVWVNSVSVDGSKLVLALDLAVEVRVFDLLDNQIQARVSNLNGPIDAILFQGDLIISDLDESTGSSEVVRVALEDPSRREVLCGPEQGLLEAAGLVGTDQEVWVTDREAGTVLRLIEEGVVLSVPQVLAEGLSRPEGIAVTADGSLLVVEAGTERLLRIDPAHDEVEVVVPRLRADTLQSVPTRASRFWGVAVGPSGRVYVPSSDNHLLVLETAEWSGQQE